MKSSWNFQTPPPLPKEESETSHSTQANTGRPYDSDWQSSDSSIKLNGRSVITPQNGSRVHKASRSGHFAPGVWTAVICSLLCAGWLSAALFPINSYTSTPEISTPVKPYGENPALGADSISYEMQTPFVTEHNDLIVNYRLTKSDPDTKSEISMSANVYSSTDENYSYMGMPSMGFDLDEAWVSAVFPGYTLPANGVEGIEITTEADPVYTESIEDYSYLAYNAEMASPDDLRQLYRKQYPMANAQITLLSSGAETQSGVVTFEVSIPDAQESISGQVNIVYKKDGQVVFGVVHDIYSTAQNHKTFAYTPEIQVPEYDEVEVINMYGSGQAASTQTAQHD